MKSSNSTWNFSGGSRPFFSHHTDLLGLRVGDDELVLGAAAGVNAGLGAECAALDEEAFAVGNRMLGQDRVGQIPVNRCKIF